MIGNENTLKKNNKRTKNELFVNYEFAEFAKNEQKKKRKKIFEEIIKNYPLIADEINSIFLENEEIKLQYEEILEENILLGEKLEQLRAGLKNNDIKILNQQNINLEQELSNTKNKYLELREISEKNTKTFQNLENEYHKIKKENEILKNENSKKRNLGGYVKDKALLNLYKAENKELKEKWESIGRKKLPKAIINEIIVLYKNNNWSYGEIAKYLKIGKTSVYKYIKEYEQGKLKDI